MVWSDSQHKCSSRVARIFCSSAAASMDAPTAEVSAPAAASEGAADPERDSGEFEPLPTAALPPPPPADGSEAAGAETVVESARVLGRTSREPTAGRRRSAVADPGWTLLEEIMALKDEQKKAKDAKKAVTKELRNANRRRQRLKKRAKSLSDQDLLAVISLRNHERALGRHTAADDEDDDDESESELDEPTATASSAASTPTSPARPKKRARAG